jgi:hypothetical protein
VDALLVSNSLNHQEPEKVREFLGEPDSIEDRIWHYETERPGWRLIDFSGGGVAVYYDEYNRVKKLKDTRWID